MAIRDLPPEIWLHVSVFIPPKALRKLYPVNRALLELSLDEKYRSVNPFNSPMGSPEIGRKYLFHLLEPHILHRIRHLTIKSITIEPILPTVLKARSRVYQAASRLPFNMGGLLDPHLESPDIFELVERFISELPQSMTSLEIDGYRCLTREFFEIAAFAWKTLSRQLTALTVHGSWWELTYLLRITSTPTSTPLPLLTSLKLVNVQHVEARYQLFTPDADPDGEKPCIAFLESLAPTLRSLDIQLLQMSIPEFLPRVLESLQVVPALKSFTVFGEYEMVGAASAGLRHFIGRMSSSIVDLTMTPHPANLAPDATLTNLRNLVITVPLVPGPDPVTTTLATTTSFVKASSGLTSLKLAGYSFTTLELQEFFTTFQERLNNLRMLQLSLFSFNLDMLELLASTVPNLSDLEIQAFFVCPDKHGEGERWMQMPLSLNDWLPAYKVHKPIAWNLNYLELLFSPGLHTLPLFDDQLKAELRRMIPSLTCIHNVLREKMEA